MPQCSEDGASRAQPRMNDTTRVAFNHRSARIQYPPVGCTPVAASGRRSSHRRGCVGVLLTVRLVQPSGRGVNYRDGCYVVKVLRGLKHRGGRPCDERS
jgi:hypothetical protein